MNLEIFITFSIAYKFKFYKRCESFSSLININYKFPILNSLFLISFPFVSSLFYLRKSLIVIQWESRHEVGLLKEIVASLYSICSTMTSVIIAELPGHNYNQGTRTRTRTTTIPLHSHQANEEKRKERKAQLFTGNRKSLMKISHSQMRVAANVWKWETRRKWNRIAGVNS